MRPRSAGTSAMRSSDLCPRTLPLPACRREPLEVRLRLYCSSSGHPHRVRSTPVNLSGSPRLHPRNVPRKAIPAVRLRKGLTRAAIAAALYQEFVLFRGIPEFRRHVIRHRHGLHVFRHMHTSIRSDYQGGMTREMAAEPGHQPRSCIVHLSRLADLAAQLFYRLDDVEKA
jgi:hypothetical protein